MRQLSLAVIVLGLCVIGFCLIEIHLKSGCSYLVSAHKILEAL